MKAETSKSIRLPLENDARISKRKKGRPVLLDCMIYRGGRSVMASGWFCDEAGEPDKSLNRAGMSMRLTSLPKQHLAALLKAAW